jgi:hypothetical protein
MQTGTWRDRGIALGAVLLWHVMVGWWLLQTLNLDEDTVDANALQIVYVDRPVPPAPVRVVTTHHPARISPIAPTTRETQIVAATPPQDTLPPATARPLSAVFLDQSRLAARHESGAFAQHGFDRPPPELPGAGSQNFRMRSQITPQSAVVWVSKHLFYPPGYAADPCPRNNENIGNLMAHGDSAAIQQEVEFERAHCRP